MAVGGDVGLSAAVLLASAVGLFVGPALALAWPRDALWRALLDGFTLAAVGGLCVLHLLPEAVAHGGWGALLFAALGALIPRLLGGHGTGSGLLVLAGVWLHAATESAALAASGADGLLGLAVVLHRVPLGLAVFSSFAAAGTRRGLLAVASVAAAIAVGVGLGAPLEALASGPAGWLEGLVAGMLLHVAFDAHDHGERPRPAWSTLGAVLGIAVVLGVAGQHGHGHDLAAPDFAQTLGTWVARGAPALLLAYAVSALLRAVSPARPVPGVEALFLTAPLIGLQVALWRAGAAIGVWGALRGQASPDGRAPAPRPVGAPARSWLRQALGDGLIERVATTLPWIVVGSILAAVAEPLLGHDLLGEVSPGMQVPAAALVGASLGGVVLAGATPVAAMALHKGLSPGAALGFLVAGLVMRALDGGTRAVIPAIVVGALVGWGADLAGLTAGVGLHASAAQAASAVEVLAVFGLAALLTAASLREGPRGLVARLRVAEG